MDHILRQGDLMAVYSLLSDIVQAKEMLNRAREIKTDHLANLNVEIHLIGDGVEDVEPFRMTFLPTGVVKQMVIDRCLLQMLNLKQGLEYVCLSSGRQAQELLDLGKKAMHLRSTRSKTLMSPARWKEIQGEIDELESKFFNS